MTVRPAAQYDFGVPIMGEGSYNKLRWKSIAELPDFPSRTFGELQERLTRGDFYIVVDHTFALWMSTRQGRTAYTVVIMVTNLFLYSTPIALVAAAVALGRWWLLCGAVAAVVAFVLANPYGSVWVGGPFSPIRRLPRWLSVVGLVVAANSLRDGSAVVLANCLAYSVPFEVQRILRRSMSNSLADLAASHEHLFLMLWQNRYLWLIEATTGRSVQADTLQPAEPH